MMGKGRDGEGNNGTTQQSPYPHPAEHHIIFHLPASRPPISVLRMSGWVYIMTNQRNGTLYIGVTADLVRRATEHRMSQVEGFSTRYGLTRLVYAEEHATLPAAIQREKAMKAWQRAWKLRLIEAQNPNWDDLYETLV